MSLDVPESFCAAVLRAAPTAAAEEWLLGLPRAAESAFQRWELRPDGEPVFADHAVVIPVRRSGAEAVLKLGMPRTESAQEHLALRAWADAPAVNLLAADPSSSTLLLERLDGDRDLHTLSEDEACLVLGELLARLDRPAPPRIVPVDSEDPALTALVGPESRALPRRLVQQARSWANDLMADAGERDGVAARSGRLVHANLHFGNVLAGVEGWVAIAPQAVAAEPAYGVAPVLWGRFEELGDDIGWGVHRRLGWLSEAAGVDEDRARGWALVRTVDLGVQCVAGGDGAGLTRCVALAKALAQRW